MQWNKRKFHSWILVLIISLLLFIFSVYHIITANIENKRVQNEYKKLSYLVHTDDELGGNSQDDVKKSSPSSSKSETQTNNSQTKLLKVNSDFAGWLSIPQTIVDYPVMQNQNNFYLHHDFYKKKSRHGVPFLAAECRVDTPNSNILIYGHHMRDGTMFAELMKYEQKDYYKKHKKIVLATPDETMNYEVSAVCKVDVLHDLDIFNYLSNQPTKEHFSILNEQIKDKQLYSCETHLKEQDFLLTLATCEYSKKNTRLIVIAKRLNKKGE